MVLTNLLVSPSVTMHVTCSCPGTLVVLVLTRVLVLQNEPVTEVNLESVGLFLEHVLQRRL